VADWVSIEVEVIGNGRFAGSRSNLSSYSVVEDATPLSPADASGQTGTISFIVTEDPEAAGSILLLNDTVVLTDTGAGETIGTVNAVSVSGGREDGGGAASVTGDSRLALLNASGFVPPFTGTLEDGVRAILALAGITDDVVITAEVASLPVSHRGITTTYWQLLKDLCGSNGVTEIALVSNNVVTRFVREREANVSKLTDLSWSVNNIELAQYVEVAYYNYVEVTDELVYPYGGWTPDVQVLQVDAGATTDPPINIPVNVSLTSIDQPSIEDFVDRDYDGPDSVYSVSGNDGLPIPAAQWTAQGGRLTVAIGADGNSIDVTITGASETEYAPYQIAVAAGPSDTYSTLRLVGSGLGFDRKILKSPTGVPAEKSAQEVGITVDNPWVDSLADAYDAAIRAGQQYAAPRQTVTITATVVNRGDSNGSYAYPKFSDFASEYSGQLFSDFDTEFAGQTFKQFNAYQLSLVQDDFENQVFGNVGGARLPFRNAYYRIRSANVTEDGVVTATAERDTTFTDFNTAYDGLTFSDWNDLIDSVASDMKFEDYALIPLLFAEDEAEGFGFGFGGFGSGPFGG
jgi:hypothetical protein